MVNYIWGNSCNNKCKQTVWEKFETFEYETLWYMCQPSSLVVLTDVLQCTVLEGHICLHRSATKMRNGATFYLLPVT
jgi:hypothetical protein